MAAQEAFQTSMYKALSVYEFQRMSHDSDSDSDSGVVNELLIAISFTQ
jgi:hypothetical protein